MLNGKFFTGLPPKMMERSTGAQNRLESHLFWPDDSKTESAHDIRLKRRTSFQTETPRDGNFQRRTSWCGGDNEVDTKQRFHKEFANSSIQFCDNIQEEEMDGERQSAIRKPQTRKTLKQNIAKKPNEMKIEMPNNEEIQEDYAAIKKNQTFSSKIQFYDYVDDNERRNNKLKPKMDMNDKKDVERNTKNSPKLQVKGIVRNLRIVDEQRNNQKNQHEHIITPERDYGNYDDEELPIRNEARVYGAQRSGNGRFGERSDRQRRYESPIRSYRHNNLIDEGHDYGHDDEAVDVHEMPQQYNERRALPRAQSVPKRILKNPIRDERDFEEQRRYSNDLEYVERGAREMRLRTSPKKHVTYDDEIFEYERHNGNHHNDNDDESANFREEENVRSSTAIRTATYGNRYQMKSTNRPTTGNNQRQQQKSRSSVPDYEGDNIVSIDKDWTTVDRTVGNNALKKSLNSNKSNNNNNNKNKNNNSNNNNHSNKPNNLTQQRQQRQITPKISTSSMASMNNNSTTLPTSPVSPTTDSQKHLRSSLCFSGGEIVANNRSEAGTGTPTSESNSRRTARSAATTRRICVGLPD